MAHGQDKTAPAPQLSPKFQNMIGNAMRPSTQVDPPATVAEAPEPAAEPKVRPTPAKQPKPKTGKSSSLRAKEKDITRTQRITFYATSEEYEDCLVAKARMRKPVTDIAREATMGLLYNGYICANCGKSFILLNEDSNKKEKPNCCPCCGNDKLGRIVNL